MNAMKTVVRCIGMCGAVMLAGAIADATAETSNTRRYSIYEPDIQHYTIYRGSDEPGHFAYNHCVSIERFDGKMYAVWQANYENREGWPGRRIYLAVSEDDGKTWSEPTHFVGEGAVNPILPSVEKSEMQSQPNLLNYKDKELWCLWSIRGFTDTHPQAGTYLSRLKPGKDQKWVNQRIWVESDIEGKRAYAYPSQNPILLHSGRVVAPVTFDTAQTVPGGRYPVFYNAFLYTDDDGQTWHKSNMISLPHNATGQWEPCVHQKADGDLLAFMRNFSCQTVQPNQWLLTSVGTGVEKGETLRFDPDSKFSFIETANTRMHAIPLASGRFVLFHHDVYVEHRSYESRLNGALFFSRTGEDDFVAGPAFQVDPSHISAYPQGIEYDDKIYVAYTLGGIHKPRSLKLTVFDPSPSKDQFYIWLRDKQVARANDFRLVRAQPYNYLERTSEYIYQRPYKAKIDGRSVLKFEERGTAGLEVDPVCYDDGQRLRVSFDVKIETLQSLGNLVIATFGDQIPIRIAMPSNRPGMLYVYSADQWQPVGPMPKNKWHTVTAIFGKYEFTIKSGDTAEKTFQNPLVAPTPRLYLGDGFEIDEYESNRGSVFLADIESIETELLR